MKVLPINKAMTKPMKQVQQLMKGPRYVKIDGIKVLVAGGPEADKIVAEANKNVVKQSLKGVCSCIGNPEADIKIAEINQKIAKNYKNLLKV